MTFYPGYFLKTVSDQMGDVILAKTFDVKAKLNPKEKFENFHYLSLVGKNSSPQNALKVRSTLHDVKKRAATDH